MNPAAGTVEYELGTRPVIGCGVSWKTEELDAALSGPVSSLLFDLEGTVDIEALLESLIETDFDSAELSRILNDKIPPKDWEVGQAIAEAYLIHHRDSFFPWPVSRDSRKPKSSLPGADMVGFHGKDQETRFAFGEVKTSQEDRYPPQVVKYGEHPLNTQLMDLRDKQELRDKIVKYLGHRATQSDWKETFKNATKNYIASEGKAVVIFGVLVRDVLPKSADLEATNLLLSQNCCKNTFVELLAIYLPPESINGLGERVTPYGEKR